MSAEIKTVGMAAERQIGRFSVKARREIMKILEEFERTQVKLFQSGEIDYDMHIFLAIHLYEIYRKIEGEDNE